MFLKGYLQRFLYRRGSRNFSRGADFQKSFENFDDLFFLERPNWFFELSQTTIKTLFWPIFLRRRQNSGKQAKNSVSRPFLENFDQKTAFFRRVLPPQN